MKIAIAGALALGGPAAYASNSDPELDSLAAAGTQVIAAPSTDASTVLLFAEVLKGTTVIASYGGNTGVKVTTAYAGTAATFLADANLKALFAADKTGDTLVWAVIGGEYSGLNSAPVQSKAGATKNVTTSVNPKQIPTRPTVALTAQNAVLSSTITTLNTNITARGNGTDVEGKSAASDGVWDANTPTGVSDWGGIETTITGFATVNLYSLTGSGTVGAKLKPVTNGKVTLSATGLVFVK